ncbi:hypothetical protein M3Y99_01065800 [Aphelenchoides fujianensis]|nr:hypothetical protein M3Y99_01065800 [Aphelenchoides fujianensis]
MTRSGARRSGITTRRPTKDHREFSCATDDQCKNSLKAVQAPAINSGRFSSVKLDYDWCCNSTDLCNTNSGVGTTFLAFSAMVASAFVAFVLKQ